MDRSLLKYWWLEILGQVGKRFLMLLNMCLLDLIPINSKLNDWDDRLVVDGANGVGGQKLEFLKEMLNGLAIEIRNSGKGEGILNEGVGADYVQKEKVVSCSFGPQDVGIRCASFDGDADRLVYFSVPSKSSSKIDLVDGDKILSLFSVFIKEQLTILKEIDIAEKVDYQPRLGVVQTAYANGASTRMLLKWLDSIQKGLSDVSKDSEQERAALRLLAVSKLINQAVGDALSGLLLVEAILRRKKWSIHRWNELYQDLPSTQLKVKVVDCCNNQCRNCGCEALWHTTQQAIDLEIAKFPQVRTVRNGGCYSCLRRGIFADNLANSVAKLVDQFLVLAAQNKQINNQKGQ